jgi:hypothetical protein
MACGVDALLGSFSSFAVPSFGLSRKLPACARLMSRNAGASHKAAAFAPPSMPSVLCPWLAAPGLLPRWTAGRHTQLIFCHSCCVL